MPLSFRYFSCPDLPLVETGQSIRSSAQLAFEGWDGEAESVLTRRGPSDHQNFDRYDCVHQIEQMVDATYRTEHINRLLFNLRFPAFYHRERGYFLVQAGKRESRGFFARLESANPPVEAEVGALDLAKVSATGRTTGGWFGGLNIKDVSTAAIFGSDAIVGSAEWGRYAEVGHISALNMKILSGAGVEQSVMVTKDRLVLLMQDRGEVANLDFVETLNAQFDVLM